MTTHRDEDVTSGHQGERRGETERVIAIAREREIVIAREREGYSSPETDRQTESTWT